MLCREFQCPGTKKEPAKNVTGLLAGGRGVDGSSIEAQTSLDAARHAGDHKIPDARNV